MSNALATAETTRAQIGNRAFAMMGTNTWTYGEEKGETFLQFNAKGSPVANIVKVFLSADDTYRAEFWKVRGLDVKKVKTWEGVHSDRLAQAIGETLGLAVRL